MTKNNKKQEKMDQLWLFTLKHDLLKISTFTNALSAETHPAEEQWLKEQLNVKLLMVRAATRMPTVSRAEGQHLEPVKIFIKNKASK
jgi:hypothetical protein